MFGLGIIDSIKVGAAAVAIGVLVFLVWNYRHMQTVIAQQQDQIQSLQLGAQVIAEAVDQAKKYQQKTTVITRRVTDEQDQIRQDESRGDNAALDARFDRFYGVQPNQGSAAQSGRSRGAANPAP